jgi:hypothetical protein
MTFPQPAFRLDSHAHPAGVTCEFCGQSIPNHKAAEARARTAAYQKRLAAEAEARAAQAIAAERTRIVEAAKAQIKAGIAAAEKARANVEAAAAQKVAAANARIQQAQAERDTAIEIRVREVRAALAKDREAAVNAERSKNLQTQMRLEGQLQDIQRQLQQRTAAELGEGAELDLYEVLKATFEGAGDKIRRIPKGAPGADVVHEVLHRGKLAGKILYDSKNRKDWKSEYATKLRQDQIAEKADFAVLSSNKFPAGERQLHILEHVVIACPARVPVLSQIFRHQIVQMHEQRVSNEARHEKTTALYAYIMSEQCGQLLDSVESLVGKLEQIDVDEAKAHRKVWAKRGVMLREILKAHGDLCFAIDTITGNDEPTGEPE